MHSVPAYVLAQQNTGEGSTFTIACHIYYTHHLQSVAESIAIGAQQNDLLFEGAGLQCILQ
jgi:hypothetical protein